MLLSSPAGAHFLPSIGHIWRHLRPRVDERATRVAYKEADVAIPVGPLGTLAVVKLKIPGARGGTKFVKVDAQLTGFVSATTTCPCQAVFYVSRDGAPPTSQPAYIVLRTLASGFDEDSAAITFVTAVPSGTTQTFRVRGREFAGTETITGRVAVSATTASFGHTGGSTLRPAEKAVPGQ